LVKHQTRNIILVSISVIIVAGFLFIFLSEEGTGFTLQIILLSVVNEATTEITCADTTLFMFGTAPNGAIFDEQLFLAERQICVAQCEALGGTWTSIVGTQRGNLGAVWNNGLCVVEGVEEPPILEELIIEEPVITAGEEICVVINPFTGSGEIVQCPTPTVTPEPAIIEPTITEEPIEVIIEPTITEEPIEVIIQPTIIEEPIAEIPPPIFEQQIPETQQLPIEPELVTREIRPPMADETLLIIIVILIVAGLIAVVIISRFTKLKL